MRALASFIRGRAVLVVALAMLAAGAVCLAQGAAGGPASRPAASAERMSFLQLLLKGGWFMVPIGLCSLLGLAVVIERLIALRRSVVIPPGFIDGLKGTLTHAGGDRRAGLEYCLRRDCPIARVAQAAIRKFHRSEQEVEKAIEDAGANEVAKLRHNLGMLQAVAAVAPMLGLLGTVWGMIEAFQVASDPNVDVTNRGPLLGKGIYEALVTTFAGLTIAIPALIFYYYFRGRIDKLVHEMNDVSTDFVDHYLGFDAAAPEDHREPAAAREAET
ncbi:MAG: MotA/TolQ/ExbB proton channel family protein [Planctomycetes bacterium]|nr:MotA/TolQ/ExbB proton channel family protein [Planctomycetota bacterium]